MVEEPLSPKSENPIATELKRRRRFTWLFLVTIIGLPLLIAGGFRWYSLRPENCYRRGREALLAGDRKTVIRESQRLIRLPGHEHYGRLLAGLLLVYENKLDKALPDLLEASQHEETVVQAMTAAAKCYYLVGRFTDAVGIALVVLSKDPEATDARRWLAAAYYDLGATGYAVMELKTISAKVPDDSRCERLLGLIKKDNEQFDQAIAHYRESLRRNPHTSERQMILVELAESLIKTSRFDEALEALRDCDQSALVITLKAECTWNLGQTDEALILLQEALRLDPQYATAKLKRGTLLLSLGRADDAVSDLKDAVSLMPYTSQTHFQLSQAYGRQGERDQAARELQIMQRIQVVEREFADLHETASEKPNDANIRYRIGQLATQLHKADLARLWFRAALALDPQHMQARNALANLDLVRNRP